MADTPISLLAGARQSGKSTFAANLGPQFTYLTLDDAATRSAAARDPQGFVAGLVRPAVIDEIQRVPALFLALKTVVDADRRPGSFILTGSADIMLLPEASESLAGRMEVHALWPLSQGEVEGVQEGFIDALFDEAPPTLAPSSSTREHLFARAWDGGYPEVVARAERSRKTAWFRSYATTMLQRDIRDLANIEAIADLPRLLRIIAARTGSTFNFADISREMRIPQTTLKRYVSLLQATFLLQPLQPWLNNRTERVVRSPKILLNDSGLLAYLLGASLEGQLLAPTLTGPIVETFAISEVRKQCGWSATRPDAWFFRLYEGGEVDLVLEAPDGRVVGIEVKATVGLSRKDGKGLEAFRQAAGDRFHRGVILYAGQQLLPFGERTWAMPMDALWRLGAGPQPDVRFPVLGVMPT